MNSVLRITILIGSWMFALRADCQEMSGTGFIRKVIEDLGITENQMYGVGNFNQLGWYTNPYNVGVTYPWGFQFPRTLSPTNGYMAVSWLPELTRGRSEIWCSMPKGLVVYTNPVTGVMTTNPAYYILRFKYIFDKHNSAEESFFRCATNGTTPMFIANMSSAPTTNWTQVTAVITNTSSLYCYWILKIAQTAVHGPSAQLDAVQFIKIPGPNSQDLRIGISNNLVTVRWNTLTYISGRFHLEYADTLSGPWISNQIPPTVSDWVATTASTNSGGMRFYRMAHN